MRLFMSVKGAFDPGFIDLTFFQNSDILLLGIVKNTVLAFCGTNFFTFPQI